MAATSLQELFVEELRDIYDGEKRLLRALPKMARAAGSDQLQTAFRNHTRETERHVSRLNAEGFLSTRGTAFDHGSCTCCPSAGDPDGQDQRHEPEPGTLA